MDEEEDDVFEPESCCWRSAFREIKCEERSTQTPGPPLLPGGVMLPCGVAAEPRPLFYGNAGFRLHFPAHFELVGDHRASRRDGEEQHGGEMERHGVLERRPQRRAADDGVEVFIGQKLQFIGDQFHREHLQQYHRNQRNRGPLWWRLTSILLSLLFDRGVAAGGGAGGAGRR